MICPVLLGCHVVVSGVSFQQFGDKRRNKDLPQRSHRAMSLQPQVELLEGVMEGLYAVGGVDYVIESHFLGMN